MTTNMGDFDDLTPDPETVSLSEGLLEGMGLVPPAKTVYVGTPQAATPNPTVTQVELSAGAEDRLWDISSIEPGADNSKVMNEAEAKAFLAGLKPDEPGFKPWVPATPPGAPLASDAHEPEEAGDHISVVTPTEPADYIEPEWARFVLDHWHNMPDTPAVMIEGARGTGKTQLAKVVASRLGRKLVLVNCQPDMTAEMLLGTPRIKNGADYWQPGPIMIAAKLNAVLLLDEFNVLTPNAQLGIKPICDAVIRGLFNAYTGQFIKWPDPKVLLACNPDYQGTRALQEACRDVMETVVADYLPPDDELRICVGRTGCEHSVMENAIKTATAIRAAARDGDNEGMQLRFDLSPRALLSFGRRVIAGQSIDRAWQEAVINRVGSSFSVAATRATVVELSKSVGDYDVK